MADRGAKDDWEAVKLILDENPGLKNRVLFKLRELRKKAASGNVGYSAKEAKELQRQEQARRKQKG